MFCALPVAVICLASCYLPYYIYVDRWVDATEEDPIIVGLKSQAYRYTLVASIAASIPPLLDLLYHIFTLDTVAYNTRNRYLSALSLLFCLVIPELVLLLFVTPKANTRLFLCNYNAQLILSLLATSQFLCQYGEKYWRNSYFSFAVCTIYIGTSFGSFIPYIHSDFKILAQYLQFFVQCLGISVFLILAYKYLSRARNVEISDESTIDSVDDEFFCKYIVYCMLFVIFGLVFFDFGIKLEYWTQYNSTVLSYIIFLMTIPSLSMCMLLTQATRNQAYFKDEKIKQMFVRYISHEMRTPLNTAVMGLQYLRSEMLKRNSHDNLVEILDEVQGSCEISVTILNEMLDYDKLQSEGMKIEKEEIHVKDFLDIVISPFHAHAHQKDIRLVCDLDKPDLTSLLINADRNKFAQVIRNLLSNALKFTPSEGMVTVIATVVKNNTSSTTDKNGARGSSGDGGSHVLNIDVIDTGVGISKDNQLKLFKEIIQFTPGKLQSGGGSGLGLYSIMDLHQGSLSISSEGEGYGCTFTVRLEASYIPGTTNSLSPPDEYRGAKRSNCSLTHGAMALNRWSGLCLYLTDSLIPLHICYNKSSSTRWQSSFKSTKKIVPDVDEIDNDGNNNNNTAINPNIPDVASPSSAVTPILPSSTTLSLPPLSIPLPILPLSPLVTFKSSAVRVSEVSSCQSFHNTEPTLLKVLIVDDSVSNRKMLARLVRDKCCTIVEAVDGVDAVNKMKQTIQPVEGGDAEVKVNSNDPVATYSSSFDVVLMDFVMPIMEGPEAAKCMRELGYTGLIVGITGNVLPSDKQRFIREGANIVLTKPVDIRDINIAFQSIHSKGK